MLVLHFKLYFQTHNHFQEQYHNLQYLYRFLQFYSNTMDLSEENNEHDIMSNFDQLALNHIDESASVNPSAVTPFKEIEQSKEQILTKIKEKHGEVKKNKRGVEDNPEYYRVDFELASKLYDIYSRVKQGSPESGGLTFQQMQEGNMSMNYHKILEMLKQAEVKLEINQKLVILRSIKKFSFNQNFISKEQFTKVLKVIIHGLGIKETQFKPLVKAKYTSVIEKEASQKLPKRAVSIKINKNFGKLKTQPPQESIKAKARLITEQNSSANHHTQTIDHSFYQKGPSLDTNVEQSKVSTARKIAQRKRVVTDVSRYEAPKHSYLNRAMQRNKLSVVSWDSLFKMNEATLSANISIPSFISKDIRLDDIYM